jgi:hypothetical protein
MPALELPTGNKIHPLDRVCHAQKVAAATLPFEQLVLLAVQGLVHGTHQSYPAEEDIHTGFSKT